MTESDAVADQPATPTPEQTAEFIERCGHQLTPWQREALEHLAAGERLVTWPARRGPRQALINLLRQAAAEPARPPGSRP